ncbi:MAG: T9SS type A sorting domain-containing protein [candidate division WOR-3 bacterium]
MGIGFLLIFAITTKESHIDTIGWADRDRQFLGPAVRYLAYDTLRGIHAIYKNGYGEIRYNFKPKGENWRWNEGIIINLYPRNLGCLDYNVRNGKAMISADYLKRGQRLISYFIDSVPGQGSFSEVTFLYGPQYNLIGAGYYGLPKFAGIMNDTLYYYSAFSWYKLGESGPFPRHNLIVSKISTRLGYIWANSNTGELFFRESPDNGNSWYQTKNLSENVPSNFNRSLFGASAVLDSNRIHIVLDLYDGKNRGRVQLWHYCPYDTPPVHFICEYSLPDTDRLGAHTAAIDRPSIGIDRRRCRSPENILYVAWEQFDPQNIDPKTGIARADIWASASFDNGRTWSEPLRLTQPDETSKRFPYLAEVVDDTLHILYFADQEAGSWELGEGERRLNPVIYLRVPKDIFIGQGIKSPEEKGLSLKPMIPTIFTGSFLNSLTGNFSLYDKSGRMVSPENFPHLPAGVYFLQIPTTSGQRVKPIVKPK